VASRQHLATVVPVIRGAVEKAGIALGDLDGIAVTCGPGLVGALLVGVETAKSLGYALGKPVVGVNHLAGHLAAVFLEQPALAGPPPFPHVALLVSGGHTALFRVEGPGNVRQLGATRDDAAGEAFDKVAKLLGLGYPGGVKIDKLSTAGDPAALHFPRALAGRDDIDFSFSGLKTAVATELAKGPLPEGPALESFCASFQAAVVDVLVRKSRRALQREGLGHLVVCGGVAANRGLRTALAAAAQADGFQLYIPTPRLCTDNAAMIGAAGSALLARGVRAGLELSVDPGLSVESLAAA
jgi:N6-L-threonylcarbamoyladenine synthase